MDIELFRYARSIYGGQGSIIGANWDLFYWFVYAGIAFIVAHAALMAVVGRKSTKSH